MSWHFLQGSEAVSWPGSSLDGAPDVLLKLIPTPGASSSPGSSTDPCHDFRSGTTSAHSMAPPGEGTLMSSLAGSPARTSAKPEPAPESAANDLASGERWPASFARWDRDSSRWKTPQISLIEGWEPSLEIWPYSGSMRSGACCPHVPLVRHIHESDCSYWPTPRASMGRSGWAHGVASKGRYRQAVIQRCAEIGWSPSAEMQEALMGIPIGWTACAPSATPKSRRKPLQRSAYSTKG